MRCQRPASRRFRDRPAAQAAGLVRVAALICALALLATACGREESPTAPKNRVQQVLSGLGRSCGEAEMVLAGGGPRRPLRRLDAVASRDAARLVTIARKDPQAVYLGASMANVVQTEAEATGRCRLPGATRRLRAALRSWE
jgi:hypothetical protein